MWWNIEADAKGMDLGVVGPNTKNEIGLTGFPPLKGKSGSRISDQAGWHRGSIVPIEGRFFVQENPNQEAPDWEGITMEYLQHHLERDPACRGKGSECFHWRHQRVQVLSRFLIRYRQ